jgi:hypothetical protein
VIEIDTSCSRFSSRRAVTMMFEGNFAAGEDETGPLCATAGAVSARAIALPNARLRNLTITPSTDFSYHKVLYLYLAACDLSVSRERLCDNRKRLARKA